MLPTPYSNGDDVCRYGQEPQNPYATYKNYFDQDARETVKNSQNILIGKHPNGNDVAIHNIFQCEPLALKSFVLHRGYRLSTQTETFDSGLMDVVVPDCNIDEICSIKLADATQESEVCRLYNKNVSQGFSSGKQSIKIFALNNNISMIRIAPHHRVQLSNDMVIFSAQNEDDDSHTLDTLNVEGAKNVECVRLGGGESLEVGVEDVLMDKRMRTIENDMSSRTKCERWKKRFGADVQDIIIDRKKKPTVHISEQMSEDAILSRPTSDFVDGFGLPVKKLCQDTSLGTTLLYLFVVVILISAVLGYIQRCQTAVAMAQMNAKQTVQRAETIVGEKLTEKYGEVGQ